MANVEFKFTSEQIQNVTVLHVRGWLDAQTESALFQAVQEAHTNGAQRLVIDLEEVTMLTSAGIRSLHLIYKLYHPDQAASTNFKLCSAPAHIYQVLAITGFLQTVPMYETLSSALKSFE